MAIWVTLSVGGLWRQQGGSPLEGDSLPSPGGLPIHQATYSLPPWPLAAPTLIQLAPDCLSCELSSQPKKKIRSRYLFLL